MPRKRAISASICVMMTPMTTAFHRCRHMHCIAYLAIYTYSCFGSVPDWHNVGLLCATQVHVECLYCYRPHQNCNADILSPSLFFHLDFSSVSFHLNFHPYRFSIPNSNCLLSFKFKLHQNGFVADCCI